MQKGNLPPSPLLIHSSPRTKCSSSIGRAIHATLAERACVPLNGRRVCTRERIANCEECRARLNYEWQITEPFRSAPGGPGIIIRGSSASGGAGALSLIVDFRVASRIRARITRPSLSLSLSLSSSFPIVVLAAGPPVRGERADASASVIDRAAPSVAEPSGRSHGRRTQSC